MFCNGVQVLEIFENFAVISAESCLFNMVILNQTQVPEKKHRPLTCCHWNVNSLTAHKMLKKSLIEAYNTSHKYDFICVSKTYLDHGQKLCDIEKYPKKWLFLKNGDNF